MIHQYSDYGWLRGFSMIASWGARMEQAWWDYDPDKFREEVALATSVHANCIRVWIEFSAWMARPEDVKEAFLDSVAAIDEHGMKTMPCLTNRWHDQQWDYGGTYTEDLFRDWSPKLEYIRDIVSPLVHDDRILIWDLCNEPQAHDLDSEVNQKEFAWLTDVADTVRSCGVQQPITIGTMNGANIELYAPLMDVLCGHPYDHTPEALAEKIASYKGIQQRHGKPFLVNETIPGSLDDAVRADVIRFYTEQLSEAGFGWLGWALREGIAISTRRDRHDGNGINGEGFHPYFTKEGELRKGFEFLREAPARKAPWLAT